MDDCGRSKYKDKQFAIQEEKEEEIVTNKKTLKYMTFPTFWE